jgi:hypothetical protein
MASARRASAVGICTGSGVPQTVALVTPAPIALTHDGCRETAVGITKQRIVATAALHMPSTRRAYAVWIRGSGRIPKTVTLAAPSPISLCHDCHVRLHIGQKLTCNHQMPLRVSSWPPHAGLRTDTSDGIDNGSQTGAPLLCIVTTQPEAFHQTNLWTAGVSKGSAEVQSDITLLSELSAQFAKHNGVRRPWLRHVGTWPQRVMSQGARPNTG